jgi:hypothetical protein
MIRNFIFIQNTGKIGELRKSYITLFANGNPMEE